MALLADDDVVVHRDAERLRHLDELLSHHDIVARRRRIAGGMIVDEDDGGGGEFERPLDDLAGIDRGVIDGSDLLDFIGDKLVALVEKYDTKLLAVGERHGGSAVL